MSAPDRLIGVQDWPPVQRRRDNFAELEALVNGKRCLMCDGVPQVANNPDGPESHRLRCECKDGPQLGPEIGKIRRRYGRMTQQAMARQPAESVLSLEEIHNYISPDATRAQAHLFLRFCNDQGLNPFLNEAYLIVRQGQATFQVAASAVIKRASRNQHYNGYESGIIVETKDGDVEDRVGSFFLEGEHLLGGWATAYRRDQDHPRVSRLRVEERIQKTKDGTPNRFWATMPAGMIEKCAIAEAHRRAFPDETDALLENAQVQIEVVDAGEIATTEGVPALPESSQEPEPAPLGPTQVVEATQEGPAFDGGGDFFSQARARWPEKTSYDIADLVGVKEPQEIDNFTAAWVRLEEAWK